MAQYDIIGGIVDPKALQELKDLESIASKIGKSLKGVTFGGISSEADLALVKRLNAETDLLIKKTEQYNTSVQRGAKLTIEQKVAQQALNNEAKLNATVTSQQTTALQKMYAQMKLLEIEMQKNYNPAIEKQNKLYTDAAAKHAVIQKEYYKTAQASGVLGRQSLSAYGGTFQLTQVMRELPNFAIDARIGFMSLSNNLPMLIDSFKLLAERVDETGKKLGNKGAIKEFAKSLWSLNTVMIAMSTVMILFGDKAIDAIGKLFKASDATDNLSLSLKSLMAVTKDYNGSAAKTIEEVLKLGVQIDKYGGNVKYADALVKEFNKTFDTHYTKIDEIKNAYPQMSKSLIDNAIKMQAAMSLIEKSSSSLLDIQNARLQLSVIKKEDIDLVYSKGLKLVELSKKLGYSEEEISVGLKKGYGFNLIRNKIESGGDKIEKNNWKDQEEFLKTYKEIQKIQGSNTILKLTTQLGESKKKMDLWQVGASKLMQSTGLKTPKGDTTSTKESSTKRTIQHIQEVEKKYNDEKEEQIKRLAELEEKSNNQTNEGIKNDYSIRKKALQEYYLLAETMRKKDMAAELSNLETKRESDYTANKNIYKRNVSVFGANSPEAKESYNELLKANNIIYENYLQEYKHITAKYADDQVKLEKTVASNTLKINMDMYNEQVKMIEATSKLKEAAIQRNYESSINANNTQSSFDIIKNKLFGIQKRSTPDNLYAEKEASLARLNIQKEEVQQKLEILKNSGLGESEAAIALQEKLNEIEIAGIDVRADYQGKSKEEEIAYLKEIETKNVQSLVDSISGLWKEYFSYMEDKIDEQSENEKKLIDSRIEKYESETEAGKHTEKELSEYKKRMSDYNDSIDEESARKKKELQKEMFIAQQAMTIAGIWFNYAEAQQAIINSSAKAGPILGIPYAAFMSALNLTTAISGTALAVVQTIPYFYQGGVMEHEGTALLGDNELWGGKRQRELVVNKDGSFFVTNDRPTLYNLEKDATIFPDVNKVGLEKILSLKSITQESKNDPQSIALLREINRNIKSQKQATFYGMPLIKQIDNRNRNAKRSRGLMN